MQGRIEFAGATESDVDDAIEAARASIERGNTRGFDRNEDGSYSFVVTEGEEPSHEQLAAYIGWLVRRIDGHCGEDHGGPDCISVPQEILTIAASAPLWKVGK